MHPMGTWTHLDRSMKNKWWTLSKVSSSHAMWKNLSASSSIEQTRFNNDDSQTDIQFEPLIKDEETHPTVAPKFLDILTCSSTENFVFDVSRKSNYLDNSFLESLNFLFV